MFVHLHWHSSFSFLEAIWKPEAIVNKAKDLWMDAICITDFNGSYWAIDFYLRAKQNNINPIIWVEIWFVSDIKVYKWGDKINNINLIVKDYTWYKNLMQLISFANKDGVEKKPKVDFEVLRKYSEWIIAFFGGKLSRIGQDIIDNKSDDMIAEKIKIFKDILWDENVFLELVVQNEELDSVLTKINKKIVNLAEQTNTKIIINNVYNYPSKSDKEAREYALAIKDWKKIYQQDRRKPVWEFHIMSEDEIVNILEKNWYSKQQIQEWMWNNNDIAKSVDIELELNQMLFPNHQTPDDIKVLYDSVKDGLIWS